MNWKLIFYTNSSYLGIIPVLTIAAFVGVLLVVQIFDTFSIVHFDCY